MVISLFQVDLDFMVKNGLWNFNKIIKFGYFFKESLDSDENKIAYFKIYFHVIFLHQKKKPCLVCQ